MNIAASVQATGITIERTDPTTSIFTVTGREMIAIKAGTVVTISGQRHAFEEETAIEAISLTAGHDYAVRIDNGVPVAVPAWTETLSDDATIGGFHFAPGGNALARAGGDATPSINPFSCWDTGFRPACPDPRGMALIDGRFWADIYLLGKDHIDNGTSKYGAIIADGRDLPQSLDGKGHVKKLDYAAAVEIYAHHGKGLLGAEEFFAAAFGVTERQSREDESTTTGDISADGKKFISKHGLFDVAGTMWQWGTDGDPDNSRASLFGGSWICGDSAGSRCADLDDWPGRSSGSISARGRSDHLTPA